MTKNSSLFRQIFKRKKFNKELVGCLFLCSLFCLLLLSGCTSKSISEDLSDNLSTSQTKEKSKVIKEQKKEKEVGKENSKIQVYICGAVNSPGVYEVSSDARIINVLNKAGGFLPNASKESINLASKIKDEEKIYIPTIDEANASNKSEAQNNTSDMSTENENSGKVNLNTATKEQLMTLTGVGEAKAKKIIDYRASNGGFKKIEDLMNITGIKEGVFNKIKDDITV